MGAATYPLTVEQNAKFLAQLYWYNPDGSVVNLTGFSAKMQFRDAPGGTLIQDFATAPATLTIPAPTLGYVLAYAPSSLTALYNWTRCYYDLEFLDPSNVPIRVLEGPVYLDRGVSV